MELGHLPFLIQFVVMGSPLRSLLPTSKMEILIFLVSSHNSHEEEIAPNSQISKIRGHNSRVPTNTMTRLKSSPAESLVLTKQDMISPLLLHVRHLRVTAMFKLLGGELIVFPT